MLIAISVNKPELLAELSDMFGRSKYFVLHNSTNNESEFLLNPFSSELGDAGIQSAQFLIERKIDALITKDIGSNSLRLFKSANIKVYNSQKLTSVEALSYLIKDKLMLFDLIDRKSFLTKKVKIKSDLYKKLKNKNIKERL